MFKQINDLLALIIIGFIIPGLWILDGRGIIQLPGEVLGATIAAFTLVVQFYFRKKSTREPPRTYLMLLKSGPAGRGPGSLRYNLT